jgi:transposase-like protein
MHGPYPGELRVRVICFVEGGGSRREAAEQFDVSVSSAIRWVQRFRGDGTCEPAEGVLRPWRSTRGGSSLHQGAAGLAKPHSSVNSQPFNV